MIQILKNVSLVVILFFLIDFTFGVQKVEAHGVQMGYGVLPNGYIRVYIEHWHGDNPRLSSSPLRIQVTVGSSAPFTQVYAATGSVANTAWNNLPGLGSNINILSQCPGIANRYRDWVYYDFAPPACDVPLTLTILQGTTVVTTEACASLYPQTISTTFSDNAGPAPDIANLPTIVGECSVSLTAPTATDNCSGPVTGTTNDPLTYSAQGTYNVTWTYTDDNGFTTQQTQTVIVDDVTAPVPNISQLPAVTGECSATVTTIPTASDNCAGQIVGTTSDPLTYTANGSYTITWSFDDGNGNSVQQTQIVNVVDLAPVPDIADLPDAVGECSVTLTAPTATDLCSGVITGTTTDPTFYDQQGTYSVTWTYDDGNGNSVQQTQAVFVDDSIAPEIIAAEGLLTLWPPNHKYVTLDMSDFGVTVSDNCANVSTSSIVITKVTSDEEENAKGKGDGNTTDDIVIAADYKSVDLRKERQGTSNGRVYTIYVSLSDGNGNIGNASFQVQVPHNRKDTAIDDGPAYEVTGGIVAPSFAEYDGQNQLNKSSKLSESFTNKTPTEFNLASNYPNPFNPTTIISFSVPTAGTYRLSVYNLLGEEIENLHSGQLGIGNYNFNFDASNLPSGIYIYSLRGNNVNISRKMNLIK